MASFGPYEAANNPDHGAGSGGPMDPAIDSDPYGLVAYNGGFAVADAAGNDVLFVNAAGQISTLAVLPLIPEPTSGGDGDGPAGPHVLGRRAGRGALRR